jgi:hypothetical protein
MVHRSLQRYLFGLCIAVSLLLYVGTYFCLTLRGRYIHTAYGADGPKRPDRWAPMYFEQNGDLNVGAMYFFAPLYLADIKLWHVDDYGR